MGVERPKNLQTGVSTVHTAMSDFGRDLEEEMVLDLARRLVFAGHGNWWTRDKGRWAEHAGQEGRKYLLQLKRAYPSVSSTVSVMVCGPGKYAARN
jgi:hypothetical protein